MPKTNTEIIADLKTDLQNLDTLYNGVYQTPDSIYALQKTIQSFNITITDWNTLLVYINSHRSSLDGLIEMYPDFVDAFDEITANLTASIATVDAKADTKVTKTNTANQVYATDDNGNQITIPVDSTLVGEGDIVRRVDENGRVIVGNPTANNHATPKSYVDTEVAKKVNKINSSNIVYGTNSSGEQTSIGYSINPITGRLVQRGANGNVEVPTTPGGNDCATSKAFVMDEIGKAVAGAYKPKGSVATVDDLPSTGNIIGDVYNVLDNGANYVWVEENNVGYWDKLGETINWEEYNETFLAAGFLQAGEIDSVPDVLIFDSNGDITNPNWTGEIAIDYMNPPVTDISISAVPTTLTFDTTQDYNNMITNADWTGIMTITY